MESKAIWPWLSAAAVLTLTALWASAALADEGPQQENLKFEAWVHSLEASGKEVRIGATFENRSESAARVNVLLDIETGGGEGRRVFQHFAEDVLLGPGESHLLDASWTPNEPGAYTVKLGVFSTNWSLAHEWVDDAASFTRIDDGAGSEGWSLDVSCQDSRVHQSSKSRVESRVEQSSSKSQVESRVESRVTQSSVAKSAGARAGICDEWDGWKEIMGKGLRAEEAEEKVRELMKDAGKRTDEARRLRDQVREALGR